MYPITIGDPAGATAGAQQALSTAAGANPQSPRYITQLTEPSGRPVGKTVQRIADGQLQTDARVDIAVWRAQTIPIDSLSQLAEILKNQALILEYVPGTEGLSHFWLISQAQVDANFRSPDGEPCYQLKKENFTPGGVNVFDWDHDASRPVHLRDDTPDAWWSRMESVVPQLCGIGRVVCFSSKGQVLLPDGQPAFPNPSAHVYIFTESRGRMEAVGNLIEARMWLAGQGYEKQGKNGQVLRRSPFDPCTFGIGRRVFESPPTVGPGLKVGPKDVRVIEGPALDLASLPMPTEDEKTQYKELTGRKLRIKETGEGITAHVEATDLTLDLVVETKEYGPITVREIIEQHKGDKLRCQTPFRDSDSWAAFIGWHTDGVPFLFDVSVQTKHLAAPEAKSAVIFADMPPPPPELSDYLNAPASPESMGPVTWWKPLRMLCWHHQKAGCC